MIQPKECKAALHEVNRGWISEILDSANIRVELITYYFKKTWNKSYGIMKKKGKIMPDQMFEIMKNLNIAQLFVIGMMLWFFYNRLDRKIETLDQKIERQGARTDKLYEMFIEHRKEIDQKFYDMLKTKNDPRTNP